MLLPGVFIKTWLTVHSDVYRVVGFFKLSACSGSPMFRVKRCKILLTNAVFKKIKQLTLTICLISHNSFFLVRIWFKTSFPKQ